MGRIRNSNLQLKTTTSLKQLMMTIFQLHMFQREQQNNTREANQTIQVLKSLIPRSKANHWKYRRNTLRI